MYGITELGRASEIKAVPLARRQRPGLRPSRQLRLGARRATPRRLQIKGIKCHMRPRGGQSGVEEDIATRAPYPCCRDRQIGGKVSSPRVAYGTVRVQGREASVRCICI